MLSSRRDRKAVLTKTNCVAKRGSIMKRSELENSQMISAAELRELNRPDIFVQCFCNSDSEKIPMWYLYGGIAGKGASFGFTPRVMLDYIRSIKYVTELVYDSVKDNYVPGVQFEIGPDFELQAGWVFYADYELPVKPWPKDSDVVRVNYFNKFLNVEEAEQFFDGNFFIKDYPWEYEKEFRLVFINKTGRKIDKIRIDLPEAFRASKNRKLKINMDLLGRSKRDVNEYIVRKPEFLMEETVERVRKWYEGKRR